MKKWTCVSTPRGFPLKHKSYRILQIKNYYPAIFNPSKLYTLVTLDCIVNYVDLSRDLASYVLNPEYDTGHYLNNYFAGSSACGARAPLCCLRFAICCEGFFRRAYIMTHC